jgi:hypothetical protein
MPRVVDGATLRREGGVTVVTLSLPASRAPFSVLEVRLRR